MGIEALYRNPNTSKKHPKHRIYPYPLRDMVIIRPNQVWAMDMTYIPMAKGFAFLTAVIDWATRRGFPRVTIRQEIFSGAGAGVAGVCVGAPTSSFAWTMRNCGRPQHCTPRSWASAAKPSVSM